MWPYHNTWPSHVFMPGGWRKHQGMKTVRAKRRLNTTHSHMTSTVKPNLQCPTSQRQEIRGVYAPVEVFLEPGGQVKRITDLQISANTMARVDQIHTIQRAYWSPWKNVIFLHKDHSVGLRTGPRNISYQVRLFHLISGCLTNSHSAPPLGLETK